MQVLRRRLRSRAGTSVCGTIGDIGISLRSDLPGVLEDFAALYPQASEGLRKADRTIHLEVRRAGRSRTGRPLFRVFADGQEIGGWRPSRGVFPLLEWGINLRIMARRSEFLQLHAASLSYRETGFIFAGESGCGKSTLAAILLSHGWKYLCDEFALVNANSTFLHPFPKALCIKRGSQPVVRQLGLRFARRRDYLKELKGRVGYIDPRVLGAERIGTPVPVGFIVFPSYTKGAEAALEPVPRAQAFMALCRCCFNRGAFPDGAFATLVRLVRQSRCFRLTVGRPEETTRCLETCIVSRSETARTPPLSPSSGALGDAGAPVRTAHRATRRELLRAGAKLAYVTPTVLTLAAEQAMAAGSHPSGLCSTALHTGALCETDTDCCSGDCNFGVCD